MQSLMQWKRQRFQSMSQLMCTMQWLREVCSTKLTSQNIQLGGPGHIVQIDESLFRHKPKVKKHITLFIQYSFSAFNRNRITEAVQHARKSGSLD